MGKMKNKNKKNKKELETEENIENVDNVNGSDKETEDTDFTDKVAKKRLHDDNGSDSESETPKKAKKKKKKQSEAIDGQPKKGKKSIRQLKKEKFAQRQAEAQAEAKDQLKSQCLNYLSQWKHDKQNWKFMKAKQVWLYKNKFSTQLVPDASWPVLLEYFESAQGNIKNMLLTDAHKIIKQMDEWTEFQDNEEEEENKNDQAGGQVMKPNENVYNRARSLIQCLQE